MRRFRTILAFVVLAATIGTPAPSHARTIDVGVFNFEIAPSPLIMATGDIIRITIEQGQHHVQSYATTGTAFDTGKRNITGEPFVFTTFFEGGTVRFRCILHSSMAEYNKVCEGMCAVITDDTSIPAPPVIDQPTADLRERPATIKGSAQPLSIVTLAQGANVEQGRHLGEALTDENGRWAVITADFGTQPSNPRVVARAVSPIGHVSQTSESVVYRYEPDTILPEIQIKPFDIVQVGRLRITGIASDNVKVRSIELRFSGFQIQPGTQVVERLTKIISTNAECDPACPAQVIDWKFETTGFVNEPAIMAYAISATAVDTFGNRRTATASGRIIFVNSHTIIDPIRNSLPEEMRELVPDAEDIVASPVPPVISSPTPSPSPSPTP